MSKRIILTIFVIVALLCTSVYATSALTPTVTADDLTSTPVVGTETPTNTANGNELTPKNTAEDLQNTATVGTETSEDGIMPISEDGQDYTIPQEWLRDVDQDKENSDELIEHDVYMGDDVVQFSAKNVNGNAFFAGETVDLSNADFYGDVFVAGKTLNLKNVDITGDLFIAGESLIIDGISCAGNVYSAGQKITISATSVQDIFAAAQDVELTQNTYVARNVYIGAGTIGLGNTVIGRDANVEATTIDSTEATVEGKLNQNIVTPDEAEDIIFAAIASMVTSAIVCGFIFLFARGYVERQKTENLAVYIAKNAGKGLIYLILIPIIAVLLICTGVGVGVGLLIFVLYIIVIAISTSLVAIAIAKNLVKNEETSNWKLYGITILIALVLAILNRVPVVGTIVSVLVGFTGMGLMFPSFKNKKKDEVIKTEEA